MAKFYVSVDHRLIGGSDVFTTSQSSVDGQDISEAIAEVVKRGVRSGHEVIRVSAWPNLDESTVANG
jgi:hypothetical protein